LYDHQRGPVQVVSALRGEKDLPWEGKNLEKFEKKLGRMKGVVLALLNRDPAKRMTCAEVVKECNHLFAANTIDNT
jgi:hypothetical protein